MSDSVEIFVEMDWPFISIPLPAVYVVPSPNKPPSAPNDNLFPSSVLIFALIVKATGLSSGVIKPINQVIKVICLMVAILISVSEKGIIFGSIIGAIYSIITSLIFGVIGKNLAINLWFFVDILFLIIVGAIGGILVTNLKNKQN